MNLRGLKPRNVGLSVWRYMPFPKFVSILAYRALWFSKLNILQDQFEGMIPALTRDLMHEKDQEWKAYFNTPEFHRQIDAWPSDNEKSGRELLVVSCWFASESESARMWQEYGGSGESVAVKSTIGRLSKYMALPQDNHFTHLGFVNYIDHKNHLMNSYEASQAIERAFLKDKFRFGHENEVRLATMTFKTVGCVDPEGHPYGPEQVQGAKMNNFENPGLYIGIDLGSLLTEIRVCPTSEPWFINLIRKLVEIHDLKIPVLPSSF